MNKMDTAPIGKCPVMHSPTNFGVRSNRDWWPNQLNLKMLHQNSALSSPMDEGFDYAKAFKALDLKALKKDLRKLWTVVHSHGVALSGHLSHGRWSWWRIFRHSTLCATQ
jgi:catalase-peroxidase